MAERGSRRRTFGPVVLAGIIGAGLAAIGGSKTWFAPNAASAGVVSPLQGAIARATSQAVDAPAVTALALVALAAWGVVLVTRRWVRRGIAVLAALASAGAFASGIVAAARPPHGMHLSGAWPWLALVGTVVSLASAVGAVLLAPGWPEMGRRYDAPAASSAATPGPEDLAEADNIDLWKSISEGRDPTVERDE